MHALTFNICAGSPTTERKITKNNEVRIKLKNFSGCFAASSLKHVIVPNCYEDRAHTEAIRIDMHGQLFTGKQHSGQRKTKYDVCTFHNTMLNYTCARKRTIEAITACIWISTLCTRCFTIYLTYFSHVWQIYAFYNVNAKYLFYKRQINIIKNIKYQSWLHLYIALSWLFRALKELTLWKMHVFALWRGVICEDWYHSYIGTVNLTATKSSQLD